MITGSRKITSYEAIKSELNQIEGITILLHGGAKGADTLAERWAKENQIPTKIIRPDYAKFGGRYAPLERNKKLVSEAEKVIAFYNKTKTGGTAHAANEARKQSKLMKEIILNQTQKSLF